MAERGHIHYHESHSHEPEGQAHGVRSHHRPVRACLSSATHVDPILAVPEIVAALAHLLPSSVRRTRTLSGRDEPREARSVEVLGGRDQHPCAPRIGQIPTHRDGNLHLQASSARSASLSRPCPRSLADRLGHFWRADPWRFSRASKPNSRRPWRKASKRRSLAGSEEEPGDR